MPRTMIDPRSWHHDEPRTNVCQVWQSNGGRVCAGSSSLRHRDAERLDRWRARTELLDRRQAQGTPAPACYDVSLPRMRLPRVLRAAGLTFVAAELRR